MEDIDYKVKDDYPFYRFYSDGRIYSEYSKKFLKPIKKTTGYYAVNLYDKNGQPKMFFVHRLIAELFIDNPHNYPDVNHKDEDKSNNAASNLEWCTKSYNENYGTKKARELIVKTEKGCCNGRKAIEQYDLDGNFVAEWDSMSAAAKATGICISGISNAANHKRNVKQAGGYVWIFKQK